MVEINLNIIDSVKKEFRKRRIPFVDRHTHSISKYTESFDISKKPPIYGPSLEVIDMANKLGLDEIAITDHSYEIFLLPKMEERTKIQQNYKEKVFDEYVNYIEKVREKYPNIRVLKGIELKIRNLNDLEYANKEDLLRLDFIMIESLDKKPNFKSIRRKLGNEITIIYAHPEPKYSLGDNYKKEDLTSWVDNMVDNNIHFDINRQFLDKFLSNDSLYNDFFKISIKKNLLFSIGSDYHQGPGKYHDFFSKLLKVIDKYGLKENNFLKFRK